MGRDLNKDLALDTSGIGQIFGLGPEVPLVTSYDSQPIVRDLKEVATAFPLARTLEVKIARQGYGREAILDFRQQLRHYAD